MMSKYCLDSLQTSSGELLRSDLLIGKALEANKHRGSFRITYSHAYRWDISTLHRSIDKTVDYQGIIRELSIKKMNFVKVRINAKCKWQEI